MAFPLENPFCFCFLLLTLLSFTTNAQTYNNISLGSSLTAGNDNSSWLSPSHHFAFGFRQINNDGYLLAIWFNNIPQNTIVWSANRNNLVPRESKVQLTTNGQLVLDDPSGKSIWNADPLKSGVSYGVMLDSGNFVLARNDSGILWESFNSPTDTILPTQTLNQETQLISRYSDTNYSAGRFLLTLQTGGNLVMYTPKYPYNAQNFPYWDTKTTTGFKVIYNQSNSVYLSARNDSLLYPVFSGETSAQDVYTRATVDFDGVFRQYVYPKSPDSTSRWGQDWTASSTIIPPNICTAKYGGSDPGSGACGFNSYCTLDGGKPSCQCPEGYVFIDSNDVNKGCKQNFVSQICDETSQEADLFQLAEMDKTDWPGSDYDYQDLDEDGCRQACLLDCLCAVAIYNNNDKRCWKKRLPLSNGVKDSSVQARALIKIRKGDSSRIGYSKRKDQPTLIITVSAVLGSSVFLNVLLLLTTCVCLFRRNQRTPTMVHPHQGMSAISPECYTYSELEAATGGFKEELGRGACGTVYKGVLQNEKFVAVKKLNKMSGEGDQEFKTEARVIGGTNHKNLVKLLGFCNEGQHLLLVYEYMSNGSLADFIFREPKPNWHKRMQIAFGVASGLSYLHEDCSSPIIHCDIKPQNILLDETLMARISDFGLAKLLKKDQTRTTTAIRGTKGYVAPEWFRSMPVTAKVDVYSFGILLLELICCRRHLELDTKDEKCIILADWAYECHMEGKLHMLVENDEEALHDMKKVGKYVMVAIWCIQEDPSLRPAMKKVVHMLEGAVQVPIPPDPESFISTI